jgi:hypothetical protein
MVPMGGNYYSVFPLGAVLSVLPVALLGATGLLDRFPGGIVASLIAGLCVYSFYHLAGLEPNSKSRRILLALFPVFGTWTWCNLGFGGSWQIALGFALLGQVGECTFREINQLLVGRLEGRVSEVDRQHLHNLTSSRASW